MNRTLSLMVGLTGSILLCASAKAACGGGGYQPNKKKETVPASMTTTTQTSNSEVRRNGNEILIRRLNLANFNQIRPQLKLTEKQEADLKALEADIKRKGDEAITQAHSYDGNQEFDARLPELLTPDQVKILQGTKVAHP